MFSYILSVGVCVFAVQDGAWSDGAGVIHGGGRPPGVATCYLLRDQ